MPPEPGVGDEKYANGMAGTILPTTALDITGIVRIKRGINKAEDASTAHGQISSTDALQRVFPTTVSRYLECGGWICQETLCD